MELTFEKKLGQCGGLNMLVPGVALLGDMALLEGCVIVDVGFKTFFLVAWKPVFL